MAQYNNMWYTDCIKLTSYIHATVQGSCLTITNLRTALLILLSTTNACLGFHLGFRQGGGGARTIVTLYSGKPSQDSTFMNNRSVMSLFCHVTSAL